jgi:tellurite resistance protein
MQLEIYLKPLPEPLVIQQKPQNEMPYTKEFRSLWQEYQQERKIELTEDQFAALVYTFPSVLVAQADGKIDEEERFFMKDLPQVMTDGYLLDGAGPTLTEDYFKEISFILKNRDKWKNKFLEALRSLLTDSTNERNAIFKAMWQTADSSEDISAKERGTIDEVSNALGL